MALKVEPAYIGQTGYQHPVELDRNLLEGIFTRSGTLRFGGFNLFPGAGTRGVSVASGRYFINGVEDADQGGYFVWNTTTITYLLGDAIGNPRIDTFILRVVDDQYGVITGIPRAEIEVIQGVPAGVPVARPNSDFDVGGPYYKPGAWTRLGDATVLVGDVAIPGGQLANSFQVVRVGGRTVCPSTNRPSDPVAGDEIYEFDTFLTYQWNGSAWVTLRPRKFSANVGDGTALFYVVTHSFGTRDVQVEVYRNTAPFDTVGCVVERDTTNSVLLRFAVAPTTNQYRVVIKE
jgi:hypothetical protein